MLSQTAEYALRAALYLAEQSPDRPVRVEEIGRALHIPANYLSKTLGALVRAGVLRSARGPHGGFALAVTPERVPLLWVIGPFDDLGARRHCLLGNRDCADENACSAHRSWKATAERVGRFFRTTTLADIGGRPGKARRARPRRVT